MQPEMDITFPEMAVRRLPESSVSTKLTFTQSTQRTRQQLGVKKHFIFLTHGSSINDVILLEKNIWSLGVCYTRFKGSSIDAVTHIYKDILRFFSSSPRHTLLYKGLGIVVTKSLASHS